MTSPIDSRNAGSELNPREIRRSLGLNQADFWSRIGVTQSGGSRYESGRAMPRPVRELLRVVHAEGIDLARVRREDIDLLDHLKAGQPGLYESLRRSMRDSTDAALVPASVEAEASATAHVRQDTPAGFGSRAA